MQQVDPKHAPYCRQFLFSKNYPKISLMTTLPQRAFSPPPTPSLVVRADPHLRNPGSANTERISIVGLGWEGVEVLYFIRSRY